MAMRKLKWHILTAPIKRTDLRTWHHKWTEQNVLLQQNFKACHFECGMHSPMIWWMKALVAVWKACFAFSIYKLCL